MIEIQRETLDAWLNGLAWTLGLCTLLWVAGAVAGVAHRRNYNLTKADRAGGTVVRPDFLDVDRRKRDAALTRGRTYDKSLSDRETADAPTLAVQSITLWSRLAALSAAVLTLLATIVGTVTRVQALEAGVQQVGTWEQFVQTLSDHKAGAALAVAVIGAQVIVFVQTSKKTLQSR